MLTPSRAAELAELAESHVQADRRFNAAWLRYDALCESDPARYRDADQEIAGHHACGIVAALEAWKPIHERLLALMVAHELRAIRLGDILIVACLDLDHRGRFYPKLTDEVLVIKAGHVLTIDGAE